MVERYRLELAFHPSRCYQRRWTDRHHTYHLFMSRGRWILIAASLIVVLVVAVGYATGVGRTSHHQQRSYQDARRLMTRAGFVITNGQARLAASWPAAVRKHCTAMLLGVYGHTAADTVQTWVCKSPADAKALKARLAARPGKVIVARQHKTGAARYSTRQNLIFFVMAVDHATAARLTHVLQNS